MVYQIYYGNREVLFDIEIYLKISEDAWDKKRLKFTTDKNWFVELHSNGFISGAVDFIRKNRDLYTEDEWKQFKKDCEELEKLRGWLWETHENSPRRLDEAKKDFKEWCIYVENKIRAFADTYGLNINQD